MLFRRTEHHVYFDFGHQLTKVAYVTKNRKNIRLEHVFTHPTPENLIGIEAPTHSLAFKEMVHHFVRQLPPSLPKDGIFHLIGSDAHTMLKKIALSRPLPSDLNAQVIHEATQMAPFSISEAVVDYAPLDENPYFHSISSQKQVQFLVTISKKTSIQPWVQWFEEMDYPLTSISPSSIGLMGIGVYLLRNYPTKPHLMMVHFGESSTLLLFISKHQIRFLYEPMGLLSCLSPTTKQCNLKLSEARYFAERLEEHSTPDVFHSAFHNNLSRFMQHVAARIFTLSGVTPQEKLWIVLSGGPSRLKEIGALLKRIPTFEPVALSQYSNWIPVPLSYAASVTPEDLATFFPSILGRLGTR